MMNSTLEGLWQSLDYIHCEIWFTTFSNCVSEVEKEVGEKDMKSWVVSSAYRRWSKKRILIKRA